ncbi:MAG: hypothetical protein KAR06_03055 [Deltaproteobacteria bacterium]|nr:hypothetical protein [Deltaproteobacteria bacterium]
MELAGKRQNEQPFEPSPLTVQCELYGNLGVSIMQAYVHRYQPTKDECQRCTDKCVEKVRR